MSTTRAQLPLETLPNKDIIFFIDKFFIPKPSIDEFKKQMNINRGFIATLPGYIKGEAFEQYDDKGNATIITIAAWESQEKLNEVKQSVQSEFERTGFNPTEFYYRLNIKIERGQYKSTNV